MSSIPLWVAHVRGAAVLLFGLWMLLLGTPGLDTLKASDLRDEDELQAAFRDYPDPAVWLGVGIATLNRELRLPIVRKIEASQRSFRIAQTWSLYRNGPGKVRHMEIVVDGELLHRSQSSEHAWRAPQLRSRRIRPMVEATCMARSSKNWKGCPAGSWARCSPSGPTRVAW